MTAAEIIAEFELYVDDTTEMSTAEELALLNKIYQSVCDSRPWEFLKKEASGVMTSANTITLPTDFAHLVENRGYTDNSDDTQYNAKPSGVLINGTKWLQIINWSDRRQYANQDGYFYLDLNSGLFRTTYDQPSGATYSLDYKSVPSALLISSTPVFPARFHSILSHGMAIDDMMIQLFDKARSYANENRAQFASYMQSMALWNANLQNF